MIASLSYWLFVIVMMKDTNILVASNLVFILAINLYGYPNTYTYGDSHTQ